MTTAVLLAVDPGLDHTGWAVLRFTRSTRVLVVTGQVNTPASTAYRVRIRLVAGALRKVARQFVPTLACIEQYQYQGGRSHSAVSLPMARLVGRLEGVLEEFGCELIDDVDKNAANRAVGLFGKASAADVRRMVNLIARAAPQSSEQASRKRPLTNHEVDAVAVGVAAHQRWSTRRSVDHSQQGEVK